MDNISKISRLTDREIYYFRERNRNKIFQSVIAHFANEAASGLTKRELAKRLGKDPAQITRWFSGPSNWTLDTISDLLLAMSSELDCHISGINLSAENECATLGRKAHIAGTTPNLQLRPARFG